MKRILSITLSVIILLAALASGIVAQTPATKYLQFDSLQELALIDNGTSWYRWGNKATGYTTYATPGEDYITDANYAIIREFTSPLTATVKIDTEWTQGFKIGNEWTQTATAKYAILDNSGKIVFPRDGQLGTLSYGNPVAISKDDPVIIDVKAGEKISFVIIDENGSASPGGAHTPILLMARVLINDIMYNDSGYLRDASFNTQGGGGWSYKFAVGVTVSEGIPFSELQSLITEAQGYDLEKYTYQTTEVLNQALTAAKQLTESSNPDDIASATIALKNAIAGLEKIKVQKFLEYTPIDLEYLGTAQWASWAPTTTNYKTYATRGEDYIGDAGYAIIRQFTSPVAGVVKIDTEWTTGLTVGNQWTPNATAKYAITDEDGKILFPKDGQLGTVVNGTPVTISKDAPVEIEVEAGDKINFVIIDENGLQGVPILFMARVLINDISYNDSGYLRNAAFNTQGGDGWRYMYATTVNEVQKSNINKLNEKITEAEAILAADTSRYTADSIAALNAALASAKELTSTSSQNDIDKAEYILKNTIESLEIKPTDSSAKRVAFTQKRMQFDEEANIWRADESTTCFIAPGYSSTAKAIDNKATIKKMVAARSGNLKIKWGAGVYIDNSSGLFTGASAEFVIADKLGRIIYPTSGGALKVKEGTTHPIELTLNNVAVGDSFYFITFNASKDAVPVVMNLGVSIADVTINNNDGFLYGLDGAQGANSWFYMYADDLTFLTDEGTVPDNDDDNNNNNDNQNSDGSNTDNRLDGDYTQSPATSDTKGVLKSVCTFLSVIAAFGVFVGFKFKKLKAHMG